jgi:hypothetical protein
VKWWHGSNASLLIFGHRETLLGGISQEFLLREKNHSLLELFELGLG